MNRNITYRHIGRGILFFSTFLLFSMPPLQLKGQDSLLLRDYQFVKEDNPWLTSRNKAAITTFVPQSITTAELSLTGQKGGFTNYDDSPMTLQIGAGIESLYRISQRTVLTGSISYNYFSGKDMAGSAFIPIAAHRPFDIVEDSLTNLGKKHLDTYQLSGGFGTDIYRGISIGANIDYTAANYAKYKDLRHQNKLMNLSISAGVLFPLGKWGKIGANYLYQRKTESLDFGTYGTSDKVYKSLIDYANFTGHVEQFGNEGYTDKNHEMPLVDNCNGGNVQLSLLSAQKLQLFAEAGYVHRTGYYGRKSPYTITYTNHHSNSYQYKVQLRHSTSRARYLCDFFLNIENLENQANTYRETKNESGATSYNYFTPVKTANKLWKNYGLAFTLHLGIRHELPTWTLQAGFNGMEREQTAYLYPFYRRQHLISQEFFGNIAYHLTTKRGVWSFTLNGSFKQGEGLPYEDLTFEQPSDKQPLPPEMRAYLYREYQYLTSAQYCVGGQVKYAFIFPHTRLKTHARIGLSHRKANETNEYSDGCDRTTATLAIGCTF